ncbi:3-methyladenine DNA glycosylase AlkD [Desulfotomaculum arcticum]|uniref:3-methyladenine DNA glycosylase AlkD n=2 Tax=Desulfotruncus TaxID=2867377 RepID=A0A1I2VUC4_9FIRM|nr:3-methyladenine DNA glycosylase AlkD [Desulfotomaculum arcticum] [Desulfotruncus arcticus DSM 17038]
MGISTGEVRKLAKRIGKSNVLGYELWNTGYHEAKLLAVLVFNRKTFTLQEIEQLMNDVFSWDLCDHLCKNLIIKLKGYEKLIGKWCTSDKTYFKRAAFTLIASAAIHEKAISNDAIDDYLRLIQEYSCDEREHVKKAVSWALREIGKKDFNYQEKAIILAHELKESGNKAQVWIANDALKELEKLVQVEGRGRLITTDSQMGRKRKLSVLNSKC